MELPKAVDVKELVPEIDVTDLVGIADIRKGKLPAYKRPVKMLAVDEDKRYYDRPVPNYDERVGFALPGCFANNLLLREKEREYLGASKFKDQIVVDLGAGMHPDGYLLALASQAKGYVGVEAFYADYLIERLTRKVPKIEDKEMADSSLAYYLENRVKTFARRQGNLYFNVSTDNLKVIPISIIAEDALTFLKRLPPKSVSILRCGTYDSFSDSQNYQRELSFESARVLHTQGHILVR